MTARIFDWTMILEMINRPMLAICLILQRFFRYHDHMYNQALQEKKLTKEQREQQQLQQQFGLAQDFETPPAIPYGSVKSNQVTFW